MTAYRIKDWALHFEKAQSRVVKSVTWVSLPNKHDGKGYRRIMAMKDGLQTYAVWVLIVQVASKCPARGTLIDSDGPLTAADISAKTGAPEKAIENALKVLCSNGIAWLERFDAHSTLIESMSIAENSPPTGQDRTGHNKTEQNILPTEGSSEPQGDSEQEHGGEVVISFPVVGGGDPEWFLLRKIIDEFLEAFPGIEVEAECRKARIWCINNPHRRKTASGMHRFLMGWLGKAQNSSRGPARTDLLSGLKAFGEKHGVAQ